MKNKEILFEYLINKKHKDIIYLKDGCGGCIDVMCYTNDGKIESTTIAPKPFIEWLFGENIKYYGECDEIEAEYKKSLDQ